jgi:hypothetical protein
MTIRTLPGRFRSMGHTSLADGVDDGRTGRIAFADQIRCALAVIGANHTKILGRLPLFFVHSKHNGSILASAEAAGSQKGRSAVRLWSTCPSLSLRRRIAGTGSGTAERFTCAFRSAKEIRNKGCCEVSPIPEVAQPRKIRQFPIGSRPPLETHLK